MRPALLLSVLAFAIPVSGNAAGQKIGPHTFTLPDGFTIEVAAAPPLVDRPITVAFDESGALYVADSSGSNDKVEKQLAEKPHRILRLVDRDGDGRFDSRTVFVERVMFPEGTLWHEGSLYVAAPPQILKFTDTNGDGVADREEVWFDGKTLTGCANDLHGPYLGPDGFIYWCKGAFAEQRHQLTARNGNAEFITRASHIFRARPDGSLRDVVLTGGMDNPVDVVFTPAGERFLSCTFFQHPGGGQRDGLIHAVYGGVYGKDHNVLDGHARTGGLMPPLTHLGPAAPSGLEFYRSNAWGAGFSGNLFAACFNLRKVTRHVLLPQGATFRTEDHDFLVSDFTDFHPTDVVEDADGSLLVVDTGGWYKLCCPTSQLHKPDALGAIYRIRKNDAPKIEDPRGLQLDWKNAGAAALCARLGDPRPALRDRAIAALARLGEEAVTPLAGVVAQSRDELARVNAIWALTRIESEAARAAVRFAFADRSDMVKHAVAASSSLWRDPGAREALENLLATKNPQLHRIAAEGLGRIGDPLALGALARTLQNITTDRVLEHSLTYALIEIGAADELARLIESSKTPHRGLLLALEQVDRSRLKPDGALALLGRPEDESRAAGLWITQRHPEWAGAMLAWIRERLGQATAPADIDRLAALLSGMIDNPEIANLMRATATSPGAAKPGRIAVIRALGKGSARRPVAGWSEPLAHILESDDADLRREALAIVRPWTTGKNPDAQIVEALRTVANAASVPAEDRLTAFAALPAGRAALSDAAFTFLLNAAKQEQSPLNRITAARLLGQAGLTGAQLLQLASAMGDVSPAVVPHLLPAFAGSSDPALGEQLVASLRKIKDPVAVPADIIVAALGKFPAAIRAAVLETVAGAGDRAAQAARLDELAAKLPPGDIKRGHAIFDSPRAACRTCHALGYVGGRLGPDLSRVGQVRTERDLLEAIVFPSASFVRSYESVHVTTKSGDEIVGIISDESAESITIASAPGVQSQLARADVVDLRQAAISLMPPGYDQILTPQELADLIAFLKSSR